MTSVDPPGLLQDALAGDAAAWKVLVEAYSGFIYRIARRSGLSAEDAEDVTQLVWIAFLEHGSTLREPGALRPWLATIARRTAVHRRSQNREQLGSTGSSDPELVEDETPSLEELLQREQEVDRVRLALRKLPVGCARLLHSLFRDDSPDYAETSRRLRIPMGSIGPTRARCLARLHRILSRESFAK
jgi:RNA polymerase sigma factor (sigma-70 family)